MPRKNSLSNGRVANVFAVIRAGFNEVYKQPTYYFITLSVAINVVFIYYFVLTRTTTWEVFWQSNIAVYNLLQVVLSILNALFLGVAVSFFIFLLEKRQKQTGLSFLNALGSFVFSAAATGCTVCGAALLPTLGIAASLTALPFGGLEIKAISLLVLGYSLYQYSRQVSGLCPLRSASVVSLRGGYLELNFSKESLPSITTLGVLVGFILLVYSLPKLPASWKLDFKRSLVQQVGATSNLSSPSTDSLFSQINPQDGYEINASYGDLGPRMIKMGVIDLEKFKSVYDEAGQPLTKEQLEILTQGSDKNIKISSQNAYFLLNFFWAAGLANQSKVLTQGEITKYGKDQLGYFASTGGWTLAKNDAMDYYAKEKLIPLTSKQEALVEKVASNIYRPCCNNSTAFPDCNHGMALLGVLQLMASNGASEKQMYEAAKYFNAFWFPQSYYDLALYFKTKEGKDFKDVDPTVLLGKDYSSVSGWQRAKRWLQDNGVLKQAPRGGTGCGV